jgi:hypothetical protein
VRRSWIGAAIVLTAVTACSADPARHSFDLEAEYGSTGLVEFSIPPDAVAVSLLVTADQMDTLLQLESLIIGGTDLVTGSTDDLASLTDRYSENEIIETGTGFVHEVQKGTYSFTYPFAPGWELAPGPASVSLLASTDSKLTLEILVLTDTTRDKLAVTVFTPGNTSLSQEARSEVEQIFAQADIAITWRDGTLPADAPSSLDDVADWSPGSTLHGLSRAVAAVSTGGANVVMLDRLPGGLSGFATGVPGPHDGSGMAVAVAFRSPTETGRTVAHEIAHLLGLRHLEDRSSKGVIVSNPISDTRADAYNLMQFGTNLTTGQIQILGLSPLIESSGTR